MNRTSARVGAATGSVIAAMAVALATLAATPIARTPPLLRQVTTIPMPGVEGRIDHMALDDSGQRLFVVALGNNTVEVLDLRAGRRTRSLTGFREPQGVGWVAAPPRLFVANGDGGSCTMLDGRTLEALRTIPLGGDADNVRVDATAHRVCVGFGGGALATLDAATGDVLGRVELPAHPEAFDWAPGGSRIFVNVPESDEVTVVDRSRGIAVEHWKLHDAHANFPLAIDAAGGRLFLGCRQPAAVVVLEMASRKAIASVPIDGDADDLFYDAMSRRLLASCGAGWIDVLDVPVGGAPRLRARVPTASGARTSLFDPASRRLFVAVPHRGEQAAEVRVYEIAR